MAIALPLIPSLNKLHVCLFTDVKNCSEIRKLVVGGMPTEYAFLNAELVPSLFALQVAAQKALAASLDGTLRTKSLHTEIVYNISGCAHIAESLSRFGVNDSTTHLLIARIDATDEELDHLSTLVEGNVALIERLSELTSTATVLKYYKILPVELKVGSLEEAILCKMAARDCGQR